eukprot:1953585-Rhodomonas_salina.1
MQATVIALTSWIRIRIPVFTRSCAPVRIPRVARRCVGPTVIGRTSAGRQRPRGLNGLQQGGPVEVFFEHDELRRGPAQVVDCRISKRIRWALKAREGVRIKDLRVVVAHTRAHARVVDRERRAGAVLNVRPYLSWKPAFAAATQTLLVRGRRVKSESLLVARQNARVHGLVKNLGGVVAHTGPRDEGCIFGAGALVDGVASLARDGALAAAGLAHLPHWGVAGAFVARQGRIAGALALAAIGRKDFGERARAGVRDKVRSCSIANTLVVDQCRVGRASASLYRSVGVERDGILVAN